MLATSSGVHPFSNSPTIKINRRLKKTLKKLEVIRTLSHFSLERVKILLANFVVVTSNEVYYLGAMDNNNDNSTAVEHQL
jgi:hypothetical protein